MGLRHDGVTTPNHLLFRLKTCVEYGLNQNSSAAGFQGSVSSGLRNQLHRCILEILNHGLKQNFNWNSPLPLLSELRKVYGRFHPEITTTSHAKEKIQTISEWVNLCLLEQSLGDHFKLFLADKTILQNLYTAEGFVLSASYSDGMLLCLQALELKRPEFLAEIDPILFLSKHPYGQQQGSISTPVLSQRTLPEYHRSAFSVSIVSLGNNKESPTENHFADMPEVVSENNGKESAIDNSSIKCGISCSSPGINNCAVCVQLTVEEILDIVCNNVVVTTQPTAKIETKTNPLNKQKHRRTMSDFVLDKSVTTKEKLLLNHEDSAASICENSKERRAKKFKRGLTPLMLKKSETLKLGGTSQNFTPTEEDFDWLKKSLQKTQQSLVDARLRDMEISIELERENTHFYLSEMLIAAVEQMKWRQTTGQDYYGQNLATNIYDQPFFSNREAERIVQSSSSQNIPRNLYSSSSGFGQSFENHLCGPAMGSDLDRGSEAGDSEYPYSEVSLSELNDPGMPSTSYDLDDSGPLSKAGSFVSDDPGRPSTSYSGDIGWPPYTIGYSAMSPPAVIGSASSMDFREDSSLGGTTIWSSMETVNAEDNAVNPSKRKEPVEQERALSSTSSAEAVAASLLRYFSSKMRPTASEMDWLVSYRDAPQLLLPLPTSSPVAPDEFYTECKSTGGTIFSHKIRLRGTHEWAPPRPQLIFSLHPPPKLKPLLEAQNYRCAGCGLKLEKSVYQKRVRYCEYLGRFFCQVCHRGSLMQIPARILHRWDFKLYPVSDFGQRFLTECSDKPWFNVAAVNKKLYDQVRNLRVIRERRKVAVQMWDYVRTCRVASLVVTKEGKLKDLFLALPSHFLEKELDLYALSDFSQVKDGSLEQLADRAIYFAKAHIEGCQHCKAQGFLCELCKKTDVLFPYQSDTVYQCKLCGSCNHLKCCKKNRFVCPKCTRIKERKKNEIALAALARAREPGLLEVEPAADGNVNDQQEGSMGQIEIDYSAPVILY